MDRASISLLVEPPAPLRSWVSFIWYWEGTPAAHLKESVIAGPGTGLVINLLEDRIRTYHGPGYAAEQRLRGIAASGPSTRHFAIDACQPRVMGASLRPGAARAILGVPLREVRDTHIALQELWGVEASHTHERLVEAATPAARIRILCRALLAFVHLEKGASPAILHALSRFRADPASVRVGEIAKELRLSHRRFIELFADAIGVPPKLYLRLCRFDQMRAEAWTRSTGESVSWAQLAHDHGYSDQSHLIREFREFAGVTPMEYLARRGAGHNHNVVAPGSCP